MCGCRMHGRARMRRRRRRRPGALTPSWAGPRASFSVCGNSGCCRSPWRCFPIARGSRSLAGAPPSCRSTTSAPAPASRTTVPPARAAMPRRFLTEFRFTQLIDHADLFWALTRSERFLLSRLDTPPRPGDASADGDRDAFRPGPLAAAVASRVRHARAFSVGALRRVGIREPAALPLRAASDARRREARRRAGDLHRRSEGRDRRDADAARFGLWADRRARRARRRRPTGRCSARRCSGRRGSSTPRAQRARTCFCSPRTATPTAGDEVVAERITTGDVAVIVSTFGARIDAAPGAWHVWHFLPDFAASDVEAKALL